MNLVNDDYENKGLKDMNDSEFSEDESIRKYQILNNSNGNDLNELETVLNNKDLNVESKIEFFYSKLKSSIFDIFRIVADYNSLYVISGEGIIVYVCMLLSKFYLFKNEDDQNILSFNNSLNISSVIYYIEKVLHDFSKCNSSFHIIFFNIFSIFFKKETKLFENYNLIRNAFILHCKKNLIPYFIFDNWYNDHNYNFYLNKYKPLFMFVEDSSSFLYNFNKFYVSNITNDDFLYKIKTINDEEEKLQKEKNYKEYLKKKNIYDKYNEEIREISLCFYFLLINNILRDMKCVFFFNLESEKNTINAFSINYTGINFKIVEQMNEESSEFFNLKYYKKRQIKEYKEEMNNLNNNQENISYVSFQDIKDYDLLYRDEESYNEKELEMINSFEMLINSNSINLKDIVLKIFYNKRKEIIEFEEKKEYFFLILRLLFLHNYLIEKLNMKNLCIYDSQNLCLSKIIKSAVDLNVNMYLSIYNFILKILQKDKYCDSLKNIRNSDLLNFFNASILHNLISFIYFKLNQNIFVIDHDDFNLEDKDFFEKSFLRITDGSLSFFPFDFSFLKDEINSLQKHELSDFTSGSNNMNDKINKGEETNEKKSDNIYNEENEFQEKESSINLDVVPINLLKVKNEFIENFFSLKDLINDPHLENNRKIYLKFNFINKCIGYDNDFFESSGMLHLTERENIMDVFRSYIKLSFSNSNKLKLNKKDEKYILRYQQKEERRKAIIAKYFYINALHHPIVISENHPWLKYYSHNIEKYYIYLKDEEKRKCIITKMKKLFDSSIEEDNEEGDKSKEDKIYEITDSLDDESEIETESNVDELDNKDSSKKLHNEKKKKNTKTNVNSLKKKDEILKKKEMTNEKKTYEVDLERYNVLESKINKLSSDNSYSEMNTWSLDIISGFNRLVDVYNFNNITNLIKNVDLQIKISMKVLTSMFEIIMYTKLKNLKSNKQKADAIKSVILIYKLTNEIFNKYKNNLKEKDIMQLQTVLLSLGFKNSSYNLFEEYVKIRRKVTDDLKDEEIEEKNNVNKKNNIKGKKKTELKGSNKIKKGNKNKVYSDDDDSSASCKSPKLKKMSSKELGEIYKYKIKEVKNYSELKIDEKKEHEFQLYYMYYLLDRTTGNIMDKRVLFTLDTWQYNILNLVDRRKSILVSCPTSSGKTFICYYVMDKVLRLNNDSVVVYVAPNDTLALQIYHEVNGRFSTKGYSKYSGNKLCSYMTDKYAEEKALDAQIIIILPSVLENILLSYYSLNDSYENINVPKFISKIEYIIFDEIHCIGDKEYYGTQIENIIHLINCPFLALSATIGNIKYFYSWLKNVLIKKGKSSKDLHLIKFYERYSDLILYVYTNKNLHHLNPLACLNFRDILYKGISKDFYCNPREIYEIVKILFELAKKKNFYDLIEFLEPSFYFEYTRCINKKQFIYYMHSVKEIIVYLIQNNYINNSDYDMLIHLLLSNYMKNSDYIKNEKSEENDIEDDEEKTKELKKDKNITKHLYKSTKDENIPKQQLFQELYKNAILDENFFLNKSNDLVKYTETVNIEQEYLDSGKLIELLKKLEDINFLPCIVFNFERKELEDMTINLINELMKRQHDKYYGDDEKTFNTKMENKLRQEKYENLLKQREMLLKIKTVSRNQRIEQNIDKQYLEMLNEDEIPEPPLDISEEYDGDFYFCNRKVYYNYVSEIEDLIKDAEKAIEGRKYKSILIEGLKRGIGLHYEVLPYKFTIIVESLFRLGYIKIIFSNKNLSLGINIPCKSIIFAGHTLELNSLMFKQTSGRAGRRGFDLYGNIIIWNINFKNLRRLIISPLQTLSGSYSVNLTSICRSMLLYNCLEKKREIEDNNKNKSIANKPNKKKKKDVTLTVAEKEEIFEKNRSININYFSRINGILSIFYNSLYFINAFQEKNSNNKQRKEFPKRTNLTKGELNNRNKKSMNQKSGNINSVSTCTTTSLNYNVNDKVKINCNLDENVVSCDDNNLDVEENEYIKFIANEFNQYKEKNALSKFINRKYEYNELLYEFIAYKKKHKNNNGNEMKLKELCFMIKTHFLMFINILIEMGAIDEEGNIINLTELSIFLKKEFDNNLILTYLLIKKVIHNFVGDKTFLSSSTSVPLNRIIDCITYEKNYSRNIITDDLSRGQFILLFIFSHFINKIKENKICLTKILINYNNTNKYKLELFSSTYFPLLHELPKPIQKHIKHLENIVLKYLINYSLIVLIKLNMLNKKKTYLLPHTQLYIFEQHPSLTLGEIFIKKDQSSYFNYYQSKIHNYKIRSPFLASLYKYDDFENLDELLYTSLNNLEIKKNMIPDIMENCVSFYKFQDGLIKEETIYLKNSYILDYYLHGKDEMIRNNNNLGQYTWYILDRFLHSLKNIEHFFFEIKKERLMLSSDVFYTSLSTLKGVLEKYFKSINSVHTKKE
ncbi:DEAD/DEAH box helicase, putative [Plasmodium gallinaceum]|uniref:DEAD/DEAH box helicase, putative n=1 Tax=Plasmodium gallinaceum TaxID=5849 RepID=A0A1J1GVK2_PLAGA|nr:DEAD/DEAH box helicase, putative [Plasmodium gallinaceum]CRG96578.1 DEAD/DEAH box helicase, putative [Plasmodium gallinaceum]